MNSREVRKTVRGEEMPTKNARSARTPGAGKTSKRTDTIILNDHALVIVLGGSKSVSEGPNKGLKTFSPAKVYMDGKQVGMLDDFHFSSSSSSILPEIKFSFMSKVEDDSKLPDSVRDILSRYARLIQDKLPWATWTMPGKSSTVQEMTVFDPGQIKPTTTRSKNEL
jgi:hypothetical protein